MDIKLVDTRQIGSEFNPSTAYSIGDYVIYQAVMYKCIADHTGAWNAAHFEATTVYEELTKKPNQEDLDALETDLQEDLTNKADVIVSNASGSIASITDGAEGKIKKAVFNIEPIQDLHGYDNPWPAGGGKNKINAPDITLTSGGYIYNGELSLPAGTYTMSLAWSGSGTPSASFGIFDADGNALVSCSHNFPYTFTISAEAVTARFYASAVGTYSKIQIETGSSATAYAPYSNVCPISGRTGADIEHTGVNVWDEEWELGQYNNATGLPISASDCIRTKNPISVKPNMNYYTTYGTGNMQVFFYKADETYLWHAWIGATNLITTPDECALMRFRLASAYGTTYNHDISINYPSTDHDYHAYTGQRVTYQLGDTVYDGNLTINDDGSGSILSDMAMVDLGTLYWVRQNWNGWNTYYTSGFPSIIDDLNMKTVPSSTKANWLCSAYKTVSANVLYTYGVGIAQNTGIRIGDANDRDVSEFKTALNGVQLVYELATPVTISLTAQEVLTLVKGQNNVWCDTGDTEIEYRANTKLYIDGKFAELQSLIANS